jgi:hypothetical protein
MAETSGIKDMSDAEKALLTPEERAALEDGEEKVEAKDEATDEAGDKKDEAPVEDVSDELDEAGDKELDPNEEIEDPDAEAEAKTEAKTEAETETKAEEKEEPRGGGGFMIPEGESRDWGKELGELAKKFDAGDLTIEEFTAKQGDILTARANEEVSAKINEAIWKRDVSRFMSRHEQYAKSPILYAALNAALQREGSAKGADDLDGEVLLNRAHRAVMQEFGQRVDPAATAEPAARRPVGKPAEVEAKARAKAPKTLAEAPAADDVQPSDDRWAAIDKLDGMELEFALAKLSQDEAQKYLAGRF